MIFFNQVEEIRDFRCAQKKYLVKWKGWPDDAMTWEPENSLKRNCQESIDKFWRKRGHAKNKKNDDDQDEDEDTEEDEEQDEDDDQEEDDDEDSSEEDDDEDDEDDDDQDEDDEDESAASS